MVDPLPRILADWMFPFFSCFTGSTWKHVLVLVAGALLSPGRRTVTAALRVMDLDQTASFAVYHRVLSTACWSARLVAHRLLRLLGAAFVRDGPVVIGLDDTIERRWGTRIKARGIYRDPVRSSQGHFVKASGLRSAILNLHERIENKLFLDRTRKDSNFKRPHICATLFQSNRSPPLRSNCDRNREVMQVRSGAGESVSDV